MYFWKIVGEGGANWNVFDFLFLNLFVYINIDMGNSAWWKTFHFPLDYNIRAKKYFSINVALYAEGYSNIHCKLIFFSYGGRWNFWNITTMLSVSQKFQKSGCKSQKSNFPCIALHCKDKWFCRLIFNIAKICHPYKSEPIASKIHN